MGIFPAGSWNVNLTYCKNSAVTYNGSFYFSIADNNLGNTPDSSPAYWTLYVSKGDVGPQGPAGPPESWVEVTADGSITMNTFEIANKAGTQCVRTLPATAILGEKYRIAGKGATGWRIAQQAGQTIHFGNVNTTTGVGGYLESTNQYDAIEILCTVANTDFTVLSVQGNITYS